MKRTGSLLHRKITRMPLPKKILQAIEHERQIEFFAEWGHRWFDLKRRDRAHIVLSGIKGPTWQATDVWYPIPLQEILRNPALEQNPGY